MNTIDNSVLSLCRAGIGNDTAQIPPQSEWEQVFDLAINQGIGAIICDAIHKEDIRAITIKDPQIRRLVIHTYILETNYQKKRSAIKKLGSLCERNRIKLLLLKGYALSQLYPFPEHRPIGDVDIYCYGEQPRLDRILTNEWGIIPKKSSHHTIFSIDDVEVENHITLFEDDCHRSNQITEEDCQGPLYDDQIPIEIDGTLILTPNANLNALFITRHSSGHFATNNIQIRHLLDWGFFVNSYYRDIDWVWLMDCAKNARMHRFLSVQNTICIKYLGFPEHLFPDFYPKEAELADRVLAEILHPRFSKEIPSMEQHFFRYCLLKTERLWVNRWKYRISFNESLLSHFWGYSTNRVKSQVKHLFTKSIKSNNK